MVAAPSSAFGQGPTPSQGRTQALRTFRATHYLSTRRNIQAEHTPAELGQAFEERTSSAAPQVHANKTTKDCYNEIESPQA
ncbi:hypothetical protein QBZ16_002486 [Prototheca wickerhamii]|uniref:Uncharacterized protein n=1 Tax=Prototheca wickerhamii TaxID=3111 RepID=A0AAD9ING4_PROWI|nr:hypothetical protein QBZ16_002486 [Prototheca wickerhamii]